MQQIKLFKGNEAELPRFEAEINQWLATPGIHVIQVFGNIAPQGAATDLEAIDRSRSAYVPSDLFLAVLYEKR
jgi:hypothetical protein